MDDTRETGLPSERTPGCVEVTRPRPFPDLIPDIAARRTILIVSSRTSSRSRQTDSSSWSESTVFRIPNLLNHVSIRGQRSVNTINLHRDNTGEWGRGAWDTAATMKLRRREFGSSIPDRGAIVG